MTDDDKERVRAATDLADLVGADTELRESSGKWWGLCPFHEERSPSLMVDATSGHYHCFGCGAHGDAFSYVMATRGMAFPEAAAWLAERAGIEIAGDKGLDEGRLRAAESAGRAMAEARAAISDGDPLATRARGELARLGIGDGAIERWRIGFLRDAGRVLATLHDASPVWGIGAPLACVAVTDPAGRTVGLCTQELGGDGATGLALATAYRWPAPLYLDAARAAIRARGAALVTLGPLEAIALHESGERAAVCTMGRGLDERSAAAIVAAGAREITLLTPPGPLGERAALESVGAALRTPAAVRWRPCAATPDVTATTGAPELLDAVIGLVAARQGATSPQGILDRAADACGALRPAAAGDQLRASILSRALAERLGVLDPDTLVPALLGSGPVGMRPCRTQSAMRPPAPRPMATLRIPAAGCRPHAKTVAALSRSATARERTRSPPRSTAPGRSRRRAEEL